MKVVRGKRPAVPRRIARNFVATWQHRLPRSCPSRRGRSGGVADPALACRAVEPGPARRAARQGDCRRGRCRAEKHAHGMSPASATDRAPQQLTSTSKRVRVVFARPHRRSQEPRTRHAGKNTSTAFFRAARGLEAFQSSWTIPEIRGIDGIGGENRAFVPSPRPVD